jgi:hypothetical protein
MFWPSKPDNSLIWKRPQEDSGALVRMLNIGASIALIYFACLYYYWCTHPPLPAPGQAVLWIGVIAALMALDLKHPLKAASIVLIFALAFLENKSIQKDRLDAQQQARDLWKVANDTNLATAQNLTRTIQIFGISGQILEAEKQHDPALIARLEAEKKTLQKQQLLAESAMVLREMDRLSEQWGHEDSTLDEHYKTQGETVNFKELAERKDTLNLTNTTDFGNHNLFLIANDERKKFLLLAPSADKHDLDAVYEKAASGQPINFIDMQNATGYLRSLRDAAIKATH